MPQILDTPEGWFRTQQRDLFILRYRNHGEKKRLFKKAHSKLRAWFAKHLPDTPLGIMGSSEYSGYLCGGPSYFTADFDRDGLAAFTAAWGPESPWRLEVWSLADWRARVDAAKLLSCLPSEPQRLCWWDTPKGILLLSADAEGHLLSLYDGWWKLQQLFPEFAGHEHTQYPCGEFWPDRDMRNQQKTPLIVVSQGFNDCWDLSKYARNPQNIQRLKDALGIQDNEPCQIAEGDW